MSTALKLGKQAYWVPAKPAVSSWDVEQSAPPDIWHKGIKGKGEVPPSRSAPAATLLRHARFPASPFSML